MVTTRKYLGQEFRQRRDGSRIVLFVAPAEHIAEWAGAPQKTARFMTGFQRAQDPRRTREIESFFELEGNTSPTSIVVAFRPNQIRVQAVKAELGAPANVVIIEVDYDDHGDKNVFELAKMVTSEVEQERQVTAATEGPEEQPNENGETDDEDAEDDDPEDAGGDDLALHESHLKDFMAFLADHEALAKANEENPDRLRALLSNFLKPGIIVDGQHRVGGAAQLEQEIPFPVVGLVDAAWSEQVFQFVVINQKAKPIAAEFLSAIISSSLSSSEIRALKLRLEKSQIRLDETRIMDLVHSSPDSPFAGLVDFKIQGASGFLKYNGMLGLARRFRKLRTHVDKKRHPKFRQFFRTTFESAIDGENYTEKKEAWLRGEWFRYFAAFWNVVHEKICVEPNYEEELWKPGSNLLKIVTLQELQNLFLQWLFDRMEPVDNLQEFRDRVRQFITNLSPKFFDKDWKLTSLQSATGRRYLRDALDNAVKSASYRFRDPLFRGVEDGE